MRTGISILLIAVCSLVSGQTTSGLKFDMNFVEAENHWVVVPNTNPNDLKYVYGFIYFDERGGGYSLQEVNDFTLNGEKFIKTPVTRQIYALSHNKKLEQADQFLIKNLSVFKSEEEGIVNITGNY